MYKRIIPQQSSGWNACVYLRSSFGHLSLSLLSWAPPERRFWKGAWFVLLMDIFSASRTVLAHTRSWRIILTRFFLGQCYICRPGNTVLSVDIGCSWPPLACAPVCFGPKVKCGLEILGSLLSLKVLVLSRENAGRSPRVTLLGTGMDQVSYNGQVSKLI